MWTIGSILKWTQDYFQKKGIDTPRLDAEVLLSEVLGCERIYLYVNFAQPLVQDELDRYRELVKQRARRISVAHIIGKKEFMGLPFKVTLDTLAPRPDTEILVGAAVERLKKISLAPHIADVGTATATLTDISEATLAVAEENAAALAVAERCSFARGDLTAPLIGKTFTAILSNPPYIPDGELADLQAEVRNEPAQALFGGADGLNFYRRLAAEAPPLIADDGFIAVEVGMGQAATVAALFAAEHRFTDAEIIKDLAGIDRVVVAWKQK